MSEFVKPSKTIWCIWLDTYETPIMCYTRDATQAWAAFYRKQGHTALAITKHTLSAVAGEGLEDGE